MHILITGGSGLIGRALTENLAQDGHQVAILSRSPDKVKGMPEDVQVLKWDGKTIQGWGEIVNQVDAVVNLAGASIAGESPLDMRWTAKRKRLIINSRIGAGRAVVEAIEAAKNKPEVLIQSSAIGYYGPHGDEELSENSGPGEDFLSKVVQVWEDSVNDLPKNVRKAIVRTGLVLSPRGGIYPILKLPFLLFAGGPMGSGKQVMSWIHIEDQVRAIRFLLENNKAEGVYNLTAPNPKTNKEFGKILGKSLKRPSFMPAPGIAVKLALGEASTLALDGQRVLPKRLLEAGFEFKFGDLAQALGDLEAQPRRFFRQFEVNASVEQTAAFHRETSVLRKLTPFPIIVQFRHVERVQEGSTADFNLWFGPIPVNWKARHHDIVEDKGFWDTQEEGPFEYWVHRHTFEALENGRSRVIDEIHARLGKGWFKGIVSRFMWLTLPILFNYRAWRTQREVEGGAVSGLPSRAQKV